MLLEDPFVVGLQSLYSIIRAFPIQAK